MNLFADWTWLLAALAVIVADGVLVFIAWRALFADKSNGRRRCPKCWYDLAYSPGMSCAECGFTGTDEVQFGRTRRRYGAAALAVVLAAGVALFATWHTSQQGFAGMIPTRVLLWCLPIIGPDSDLYAELMRRTRSSRFTDGQWNSLFTRSASGDWRNRPVTDGWISKYGDIISIWRRTVADDDAINTILLAIEPRVEVETRAVWPADTPMVALLQVQDWWPLGTECRVTVTPQNPVGDQTPIVFQRAASDRGQFASIPITLPAVPADTAAIKLDVQVERRARVPREPASGVVASTQSWDVAWRESVTLTTRIEGTIEQTLAPANDEIMLDAMQQVFARGVVRWTGGGRSPVRFNIEQPQTFVPAFNDVAIGIKAELLCDGVLARQLNLWWLGGDRPPTALASNLSALPATAPNAQFDRHYGFEIAFEEPDLLKFVNQADGRWSLRITGDRALALRVGAGNKFWNGEVAVPMQMMLRTDEAPQRAWWMVDETQNEPQVE